MHKIIAEQLVFQMFSILPLEMDYKISEEIAKKAAIITMDYLRFSLSPEDEIMDKDCKHIIEIIKEI